jgi:hypothetical protein
MFAPSVSGVAVGNAAVEFALVGEIVPSEVETTVVANGCTEDSPAVGKTVLTVPTVAGRLVGLSVGVIVEEDSVSAKMPATPLEAAAPLALVWEAATVVTVVFVDEATETLELTGAKTPADAAATVEVLEADTGFDAGELVDVATVETTT